MTPMAPRKSLTVSPLRVLVLTALKVSPAVGAFGAAAGVCAAACPASAIPPATASISRFDQNFILCLLANKCVIGVGQNFRFSILAVIQYTSNRLRWVTAVGRMPLAVIRP